MSFSVASLIFNRTAAFEMIERKMLDICWEILGYVPCRCLCFLLADCFISQTFHDHTAYKQWETHWGMMGSDGLLINVL